MRSGSFRPGLWLVTVVVGLGVVWCWERLEIRRRTTLTLAEQARETGEENVLRARYDSARRREALAIAKLKDSQARDVAAQVRSRALAQETERLLLKNPAYRERHLRNLEMFGVGQIQEVVDDLKLPAKKGAELSRLICLGYRRAEEARLAVMDAGGDYYSAEASEAEAKARAETDDELRSLLGTDDFATLRAGGGTKARMAAISNSDVGLAMAAAGAPLTREQLNSLVGNPTVGAAGSAGLKALVDQAPQVLTGAQLAILNETLSDRDRRRVLEAKIVADVTAAGEIVPGGSGYIELVDGGLHGTIPLPSRPGDSN